jgi:RimJ/RimL family protein N-acetyltransferase
MIHGDGIRLRAIEESDLPRFVEWLNDPEVYKHLRLMYPLSMDMEQAWFAHLKDRDPACRPLGIEIQRPEGWVFIGNVGFNTVDWVNRSAELGIFIGEKQYWSQGYGKKAVSLLLRFGFNSLNLHRIMLRVHANNPRAIRSYQAVGFIHEGTLRDELFQDGQYYDVLLMSILRSEWQNQPS